MRAMRSTRFLTVLLALWMATVLRAAPDDALEHREWKIDGATVGYLDAMRYTQWFNVLASPAAVVPVGSSPEGLPIGVQVAGRPFEDERVLAVAAAIERAFGYRCPPFVESKGHQA